MLIYDRRRCRPLAGQEIRRRLTLQQRAKLSHLEQSGWTLLFVRGEQATAFIAHADLGQAIVSRDGRLVLARALRLREEDACAVRQQADASGNASTQAA